LEFSRARALARDEAVPWVRYVLGEGETLHAAAGTDREVLVLEGRKPVFGIPARTSGNPPEEPEARWVIKRFARGGKLLPVLLGDRYLRTGPPRPLREAGLSEEVRRRGIPTPRIVAAAWYPKGPFYRADLVTEWVPEAQDLVETLFDTRRKGAGGAAERLDALRASGFLIRIMARAGLRHGDLHAGNILLRWEGAAPRALILDLDHAALSPGGRSCPPDSMLRRLKRSLRRWEGRTGLRLSHREWETLEEAILG
jgi:hypothetical protein